MEPADGGQGAYTSQQPLPPPLTAACYPPRHLLQGWTGLLPRNVQSSPSRVARC